MKTKFALSIKTFLPSFHLNLKQAIGIHVFEIPGNIMVYKDNKLNK
jgi:hypothetical protein